MNLSELERRATIIDQDESSVYRLGDEVWKVYPLLSVATIRRYQEITTKASPLLDRQAIEMIYLDQQLVRVPYTYRLFVNPIRRVFEIDGIACAVSDFIEGPSLLHAMYGHVDTQDPDILRLFSGQVRDVITSALTRMKEMTNKTLGTKFIDLNPLNIKVRGSDFVITDLNSFVSRVDQERI